MDNYTYVLTIDRTSNGEYENQATSLLFGSRREAEEYVDSDFIQVVKSTIGDELTADELSAKIEETCVWDGEERAQFRYGDAIVDYEISKVNVPPNTDYIYAEKYFAEISRECEDCDEMKDRIRRLHSSKVLTDEEYDYLLENWDEILAKNSL